MKLCRVLILPFSFKFNAEYFFYIRRIGIGEELPLEYYFE